MKSTRLTSTISTQRQTGSNSITECEWIIIPFFATWFLCSCSPICTGAMGISTTMMTDITDILGVQGCSAPHSRWVEILGWRKHLHCQKSHNNFCHFQTIPVFDDAKCGIKFVINDEGMTDLPWTVCHMICGRSLRKYRNLPLKRPPSFKRPSSNFVQSLFLSYRQCFSCALPLKKH